MLIEKQIRLAFFFFVFFYLLPLGVATMDHLSPMEIVFMIYIFHLAQVLQWMSFIMHPPTPSPPYPGLGLVLKVHQQLGS